MKKNKLYAVFFSAIALGIAAISFISYGYYPVAIVNGHFITAKLFANDYAIASAYYQNIIVKSYGNSSSTAGVLTSSEIQQSVLTGLIENVLIEDGARKEMGGDLNRLVNEKVSKATDIDGIDKAVKSVYGMSLDDFKKEILVPQAERDVLTGSLFLKGQKIEDWLSEAKKSSKVMILSGTFYWNGESVASK